MLNEESFEEPKSEELCSQEKTFLDVKVEAITPPPHRCHRGHWGIQPQSLPARWAIQKDACIIIENIRERRHFSRVHMLAGTS
jgi:hypothetical protein